MGPRSAVSVSSVLSKKGLLKFLFSAHLRGQGPHSRRARQPRIRVGQQEQIQHIFADSGIVTLDGDAHELYGIGFAGVKGFAGGFGQHACRPGGRTPSSVTSSAFRPVLSGDAIVSLAIPRGYPVRQYRDVRLRPTGTLTREQAYWTAAIADNG